MKKLRLKQLINRVSGYIGHCGNYFTKYVHRNGFNNSGNPVWCFRGYQHSLFLPAIYTFQNINQRELINSLNTKTVNDLEKLHGLHLFIN